MPIPSTTFANLPPPSAATGKLYLVTDIGTGVLFVSTGALWKPATGQAVIAHSAAASSHTGSMAEATLATIAIPAGLMTPNGKLRISAQFAFTNNANTKTVQYKFGGSANYLNANFAGFSASKVQHEIRNRNAANSQIGYTANTSVFGTTTGAPVTSSVNTANAVSLPITVQLGNAADVATLESYTVELVVP